MQKARVSIIAAIGKNRELGKKNALIWRIPKDLKRVRRLTMGHPLIMGRKTYESIGKPLPGRTMVVVTSSTTEIPGCIVKNSFEEALAYAGSIDTEEIFVFGGAQIYESAFPVAHRLYLTLIDAEDAEADVFFPDYSAFSKIIEQKKEGSADATPSFTWLTLER